MHQKIGRLPTKPVNPYQQINHPVRKSLRLLFKLLQPGLLDCLDLFLDDLQPLHVPSKGGDRVGRQGLASGVRTVSSFTVALRSLGLKLRTPNWIKADFMRLTTRVCSWTNPSRSRCGRLASSSSMVGTIATVQWPRSPRSQPRKPRFNIAVSSRSVLARRCSAAGLALLLSWGFCIRSSVNYKLIEATILQLSRRLPHSIFF